MLPEKMEFTELLAKKELEWKELQHRQVLFLENALKETKKCLHEEKEKFSSLKKDFTHNLKVLAERDRDLEQYELLFTQLKLAENAKQAEISDLKIRIEKLQQEVQREKRNSDELQSHYQRKLKEHQIELERVHSSKNSDLDHHREEYEKVKRQLERKIEEVQGDLSLQKQELFIEFDSEMKKREHEFRLQLDELSTLVLSHELKAKLLCKELSVFREMELKATETLQVTESTNQTLQKTLQQKEFEIQDILAVKDARIKELENKIEALHLKSKREEETFQRKHEQLDRYAREKESALKSVKEAHSEQVQQLEKQVKELQMCIETQQMEHCRTQSRQQQLIGEKDATIEKLREEVETLKTGWDNYITQISKESVNKDLQVQTLQDKQETLLAQLAKYQKDIERYQQQLVDSVARERLMEQSKVQTELDWQKRCDNVEKAQYLHSEELIESLTKAKEQAEAEVKEKERKLNELKLVVSTVTWERDKAAGMLRAKGDQGEQVFANDARHEVQFTFASNEIQKLQQQNSELRQVIGQMRKEMESLCEQIPPPANQQVEGPHTQQQGKTLAPDYVKSLEDEIQNLKQKNRTMEKQLQEAQGPKDEFSDPSPSKPVPLENSYIQNYISGLNETIAALRADKVTSAAAVRRLEARAAHLDSMVNEFILKVQQKQAEVDQLQFQLNNETRHNQAAISCLQQGKAELEMQLTEARKEAEEYFKGNLQQNVQAVGLGNEVSALKLELASQRIPVVLSENETINQLREEILSLRQQLNCYKTSGSCSPDAQIVMLRNKLKEAVNKISKLSLEKQQLIDMGNRLRAEQVSAEGLAKKPFTRYQPQSTTPSSNIPAQDSQNRLSKLENLQYQLTNQELQFAQYQKSPRWPAKHHNSVRKKNQGDSEYLKPQKKENSPPLMSVQEMNGSMSSRPTTSWFEGDTSLQDVWKILDMGSSPSLMSSIEERQQRGISGRRTMPPNKSKGMVSTNNPSPLRKTPGEKSNKSPAIKQTKTKSFQNTPKIRNYNVKD
ncbi:coiled-coil domain-containing protein 57 [Pelodytes ibericus]